MTIDYVKMYDVNNNLIGSWLDDFVQCATGVTYTLYRVPANTHKVEYKIDTNIYTLYNNGCATEQYFYFGDKYVESLCCTGKKENVIEVERKSIGKKKQIVEMLVQDKITQNTGLKLSEDDLFDISTSPYIFQITGTTVTNYILDNESVEGYSNKLFGSRNTVLSLTKDNVVKRFTTKENNFYT